MKHALLILLMTATAFADTETTAKKEGWTFHFKETKATHSKGLKHKPELRGTLPRKNSYKAFPNVKVIPDTFDLRGKISPIQDQGQCGSCWAFSLTATLRDTMLLNKKDVGDLSQQYLVDCATSDSGCNGGYFDAANYLITPQGSPSQASYPYTSGASGNAGTCQRNPVKGSVTSWHMIGDPNTGPTPKDIETVMTAIKRPVSITVAAGTGVWESYSSGIYNACQMGSTDHLINIVGWNNGGAKFDRNGHLPPGKGVWILRNSWGPSWGEQGFMRIQMTDTSGARCNNVAEEAAYVNVYPH